MIKTVAHILSRVEQAFGFQHNSLGGKWVRTIGEARTWVKIGLMNPAYNLMGHTRLVRRGLGGPAAA